MTRKLSIIIGCAALLAATLSTSAVSAASPNLFAGVSGSGTLRTGSGVTGVAHLGIGEYEVTFDRDVGDCAFLATTVKSHSQATQAYTASGHLSVNGVHVETKNQGGGLTDSAFNLVVTCSAAGIQFAVVGYNADLVRSSGAQLAFGGFGRYHVRFTSDVSGCAFLATVGDPADGLVLSPSGVYTASGSTPESVYVETKNPGGGLQDGVPFHLGVFCPDAADVRVAVVDSNGLIARGSALTSTFRASAGQYTFVTDVSTRQCASIATRGSIDDAVPFSPTTVEITRRGPAPNTIGLEVRNLLFFGGNLLDEEFHAAVVC